MKYAIFLALWIAPFVYAQEEQEEVVLDECQEEIVDLKIDLLLQRRATLRAKANWIDREQRILQREDAEWQNDRSKLVTELTEIFKCESTYDLNNRRCAGE